MQAETEYDTPFGHYQLQRFPRISRQNLRAWDAADEYILRHLHENTLLQEDSSLLIINDAFGGLSIPLSDWHPSVVTDSYLSMQGIRSNASDNGVEEGSITIIDSLLTPDRITNVRSALGNHIVLIKVPKSLSMLEDQLHRIRPLLGEDSIVIAAAMSRHVHTSTMQLFEQIIGPTKSSIAWKKSRLIQSRYDPGLVVGESPYPKSYLTPYELDGRPVAIKNHAAVFSQAKLDQGTRLFIDNIPVDSRFDTIVDLGCGNGILGLMAAVKNTTAKVIFTDESYMAVESSIINFLAVFEDTREAEFLQTDCLQSVAADSVSLILCNPPFHHDNAITDATAWQMFTESRSALEHGGELWVIGNRHLAYHAKLKKLFGNAAVAASNDKFVIVRAIKQ